MSETYVEAFDLNAYRGIMAENEKIVDRLDLLERQHLNYTHKLQKATDPLQMLTCKQELGVIEARMCDFLERYDDYAEELLASKSIYQKESRKLKKMFWQVL